MTDIDAAIADRPTVRLTVGQAIVHFLMAQHVERDGQRNPFFGGALGIFGHGNLAGVGQALLQYEKEFRLYQGRHEQAMVHVALGYARMRNRLGALACTTSIGPGAMNMVTGAGTATVNHLPVLLLPSDTFATRRSGPVLQQLEPGWSMEASANDAFKAVSKYWDRINRPEQLPDALMNSMRVLTSPAETGAVTVALPQDVQAEAHDWPSALFAERVWRIQRARADRAALAESAAMLRQAERPLIVAGGGVIYSDATDVLLDFAESTGIPVGLTQSGKAAMPFEHPQCLGALGASGSRHANRLANEADLIVGIGTRFTDFTTASNTLFKRSDVKFINVNVRDLDALKMSGVALMGDARETLTELLDLADSDWHVSDDYQRECARAAGDWRAEVIELTTPSDPETLTQAEAIGIVNGFAGERSLVVNAAGSMPGDLHRLWRTGDRLSYHIEYGFSCMGYEIPGALGAKLGDPERDVYAFIGDGSWLMLSQEVMTAVQEKLKLTILLVDNKGYGSIAALSEALGSQGFATRFNYRGEDGLLSGEPVDVDLAENARSLGANVLEAGTAQELRTALEKAKGSEQTTVIYVRVDAKARFGGSGAWWDVPVAEVSALESTQRARVDYEAAQRDQRFYL